MLDMQTALSVGAALASGVFALLARNERRQERRLNRHRDVIAWAKDAMKAITSVEQHLPLLSGDASNESLLVQLKLEISAAVDQGRLFFPNDSKGFRPAILDPLVRTFRLLDDAALIQDAKHARDCMSRHRKDFWVVCQLVVEAGWTKRFLNAGDVPEGGGASDYNVSNSNVVDKNGVLLSEFKKRWKKA
jgi:hypothetical protein